MIIVSLKMLVSYSAGDHHDISRFGLRIENEILEYSNVLRFWH